MDFSRRSFLEFIRNTTLFSLCFLFLHKYDETKASEPELRPPGAVDEEAFISGCIRCGICVDVCRNHQTNVLRIMTVADGYQNAGLPIFASPESYCTRCMECNLVCPTNVLKKTAKDKLGIGTAFIIKENCLLSNGKHCNRCFDFCEIKAIVEDKTFVFQHKNGRYSKKTKVSFPLIDEDICDGCGLCAHQCPAFQIKYDAGKRQPGG